jgi:hypothetical protein
VSAHRVRDRFMPWAGLALGTAGFFLAHQLGSDATFHDCSIGSPWIVAAAIGIALAIITVGALGSWRVYRASGTGIPRRVIAAVSLMSAALFALATVLPFIAALIIPRCWA